jgi:hypothetical protein
VQTTIQTEHRRRKNRRRKRHWAAFCASVRQTRNLIARDLLAPHGSFRPKAKPARRKPVRHPRHKLRLFVDAIE